MEIKTKTKCETVSHFSLFLSTLNTNYTQLFMQTRLSKIARLPAEIREQLNRRLHDGELGRTILPWVNELPETKKVLAELFVGKRITHQNLSEWRSGGYQDWLQHQQRLEWFDRLSEQEKELKAHDRCFDTYETMGRLFMIEFGQTFAAMQNIKNPNERWDRFQNITHAFARLQNAYNLSRRIQLEFDTFEIKYETNQPTETEPEDEDEPEVETEDDDPIEAEQENVAQTFPSAGSRDFPVPCPEIRDPQTAVTENQPEETAVITPEAPTLVPPEPRESESPLPVDPPETIAEPKQPPPFQPIPTYSAPHPCQGIYHQPIPPQPVRKQPRYSPAPIRGRRFICVEG
jgi:hypothetical protein